MSNFRCRVYEAYRSTTSANPHKGSRMPLPEQVRQYRQRWGRFLPDDKTAPILDIGCGGGEFLYFLQEQGFTNLHGVDVSPEQIAAARKLGIQNVEVADACTYLKQHREPFQLISALSVLEHLNRQEMFELLDEVVRALRPGGLFLAVVPNSLSPFGARVRYGDIMHEQSFTPGSIVQICAIVGLEPVAILERGPVVHGLKSAVRWVIWQIIRGFILLYLLAESADYRWRVYTQDMRVVTRRPV